MGTLFVFAGAEVPSHRILLVDNGVEHIAVNYARLLKRGLPKTKKYLFAEKIPENIKVYLYPGDLSEGMDHDEFAAAYLQFASDNLDRLTGVLEPHGFRKSLLDTVGEDVGWVLWDPHTESLDSVSQGYAHVAIPGAEFDNDTTLRGRLRGLQSRYDTRYHALAFARPEEVRALPLDTVITHAWLAPMMRGETVVWDGVHLSRYPKKSKDQARMRLVNIAQRAGLDIEKIKSDDPNEVTRLAIWSYLQVENHMDRKDRPFEVIEGGKRSDHSEFADDPGDAETGSALVDQSAGGVRNAAVVVSRPQGQQMALPVFGIEVKQTVEKDENGNDVVRDSPILKSTTASLRQCNTCFVAANCPAFVEDNECAFSLPVKIETKEQMVSMLNAVLEMQVARVGFGRFAEEMNGGYADPNVSNEIDRLFKLVKTMKELEDNRSFERITIERNGSGGVLSAIFGERATEKLRELPGGAIPGDAVDRMLRDGPPAQ